MARIGGFPQVNALRKASDVWIDSFPSAAVPTGRAESENVAESPTGYVRGYVAHVGAVAADRSDGLRTRKGSAVAVPEQASAMPSGSLRLRITPGEIIGPEWPRDTPSPAVAPPKRGDRRATPPRTPDSQSSWRRPSGPVQCSAVTCGFVVLPVAGHRRVMFDAGPVCWMECWTRSANPRRWDANLERARAVRRCVGTCRRPRRGSS